MSGNPNVKLPEALFPEFFLGFQESGSARVRAVNANAEERIAVTCPAVLPGAGYPDGILGDTAEALAELFRSPVEFLRFDLGAVVIVQR